MHSSAESTLQDCPGICHALQCWEPCKQCVDGSCKQCRWAITCAAMLRVRWQCRALLTVAGEPMESAAAQSVLAAAQECRLMSAGSVPLQKRALSVPCMQRDNLCFAGSFVQLGSCSNLAAVGEAEAGAAFSSAQLSLPSHTVSVLAQLTGAAEGKAGLSCLTAASGAAAGSEQGSEAGTPLAELPCHSDGESPAESEAGSQGKQTSWRSWSPKRAALLPACVSSVCWSDDGRSCSSRSDFEECATCATAAAEAAATDGLALAPALEHPLAVPGLPFDAETRSYLVVSLLSCGWQSTHCRALQQPALCCCPPQPPASAVLTCAFSQLPYCLTACLRVLGPKGCCCPSCFPQLNTSWCMAHPLHLNLCKQDQSCLIRSRSVRWLTHRGEDSLRAGHPARRWRLRARRRTGQASPAPWCSLWTSAAAQSSPCSARRPCCPVWPRRCPTWGRRALPECCSKPQVRC